MATAGGLPASGTRRSYHSFLLCFLPSQAAAQGAQ